MLGVRLLHDWWYKLQGFEISDFRNFLTKFKLILPNLSQKIQLRILKLLRGEAKKRKDTKSANLRLSVRLLKWDSFYNELKKVYPEAMLDSLRRVEAWFWLFLWCHNYVTKSPKTRKRRQNVNFQSSLKKSANRKWASLAPFRKNA